MREYIENHYALSFQLGQRCADTKTMHVVGISILKWVFGIPLTAFNGHKEMEVIGIKNKERIARLGEEKECCTSGEERDIGEALKQEFSSQSVKFAPKLRGISN